MLTEHQNSNSETPTHKSSVGKLPKSKAVLSKKKLQYMQQKIKDRVGEFEYDPEKPDDYKKARK